MKALLKSKSFWVVVLDFVFSVILYFVGKYLGESVGADVRFMIGVLQPVALVLVAAFTYDDVEARKAQTEIEVAKMDLAEARAYRSSECCKDEDCCK